MPAENTRKVAKIVFVLGLVTLVAGAVKLFFAASSSSWPHTNGKIISSSVTPYFGNRRGDYEANVRYEYVVHGKRYEGDRITYFETYSQHIQKLRNLIAPYPAGAQAQVYYDSSSPNRSVLIPGLPDDFQSYGIFIGGVFMTLIAALMLKLTR